jgi:heat shock protein HslJ
MASGTAGERAPVAAGATQVPGPAEAGALQGFWRAVEIDGIPTVASRRPAALWLDYGRASGSGGCNAYSGPVEIAGGRLRFGTLAATRMGCGDVTNAQEDRFHRILAAQPRYSIEGSGEAARLTLRTDEGATILFRRAAPGETG